MKLCRVHGAVQRGAWPLRMKRSFWRVSSVMWLPVTLWVAVWDRPCMCSPPAINDAHNPPSCGSTSVRMGWGGLPRSKPTSQWVNEKVSDLHRHSHGLGKVSHCMKEKRPDSLPYSGPWLSLTASHMLLVYSRCVSFSGPSFQPQDICTDCAQSAPGWGFTEPHWWNH